VWRILQACSAHVLVTTCHHLLPHLQRVDRGKLLMDLMPFTLLGILGPTPFFRAAIFHDSGIPAEGNQRGFQLPGAGFNWGGKAAATFGPRLTRVVLRAPRKPLRHICDRGASKLRLVTAALTPPKPTHKNATAGAAPLRSTGRCETRESSPLHVATTGGRGIACTAPTKWCSSVLASRAGFNPAKDLLGLLPERRRFEGLCTSVQ
jgi:hypothetical protein